MSHVADEDRCYLTDRDEFGRKTRTFLGIANSAAVLLDDNTSLIGYAGNEASIKLIDETDKMDGMDQVHTIPTDFRVEGIGVLTQMGIAPDIQAKMLRNYMTDFTKVQRAEYVAQYDAAKASGNTATISAFAQAMLSMLNY
jgi:hypothetical protein